MTVTLRSTKGSILTIAEVDGNFQGLDQAVTATIGNLATTSIADRNRANHTGTQPASSVVFASDSVGLDAWRASVETRLSGAASAPVITTAPGVPTGTKTVGSTLTFGSLGSVTNGSGGGHTDLRQWNRVNLTTGTSTPIPGYTMSAATPTTYVLSAADLGFYISGSQQAVDTVNGLPSNVMTSLLTTIITGTTPTNSVAPALSPSGTQAAGVVITCSTGTWANASTYGYQFYDNGVPIGTRSSTATTTLTSAQAGHSITADVIATSSLGVASAAVAASNTITVSGTNTVVNTVLPTITRANGEGAGIIYSGFTYPIVAATWTLNGSGTTPSSRQWDFYKNGVYYASNPAASFSVDGSYAVNDVFKLVETVVISGTQYSSSLASATAYTVNAAPATLTVQVNTAANTFTSGSAITPYIPVTATGGTTPYTYSVNPALPSTLSLNTSTGQISGTANTVGTGSYTISVRDSAGSPATVSGSTSITINSAVVITPYHSLDATSTFSGQQGIVQTSALNLYLASELNPWATSVGSPNTAGSGTVDGGGGFNGGTGSSGSPAIYTTTINGSPWRLAKVADPAGVKSNTVRMACISTDTGGGLAPRCDISYQNYGTFTTGDNVWLAGTTMIPATVYNRTGGVGTGNFFLLWDMHSPNTSGVSLAARTTENSTRKLVLYTTGTDTNGIIVSDTTNNGSGTATVTGGVWFDWVCNMKIDIGGGGGFVKFWINGVLLASVTGAQYANGEIPVYFKLACYPGSAATPAAGIWWHHYKVKTVKDNSAQYTIDQIRALVQ